MDVSDEQKRVVTADGTVIHVIVSTIDDAPFHGGATIAMSIDGKLRVLLSPSDATALARALNALAAAPADLPPTPRRSR